MATTGRKRKDGTQPWRAHWRDDLGNQRNKTFRTREKAEAWERKMHDEREDRVLGRNTAARSTSLDKWIVEWWDLHLRSKPLNTQESYARAINTLISPAIGGLAMIDMTPQRIAQWRDELGAQGVKPSQVANAMRVLSSCLGRACERGLVPGNANPCAPVRKPEFGKGKRQRWPLSPREVELLRLELLAEARGPSAWAALRGATIVSVMAYAGLRPEEVMGLKCRAYNRAARTLIVEDVFAADHREGDTKTHQDRVVSLSAAADEDLRLWLDVLEETSDRSWLFPPQPGEHVTRWTHRNWTARTWRQARDAVVCKHPDLADTLGVATPAVLRTSFVSLLAREGRPDAEIAEEAGHSVQVLRKHYLGVIKTMRRLERLPADEWILQARASTGTPAVAQALRRELLGVAARQSGPLVKAAGPPARELSA